MSLRNVLTSVVFRIDAFEAECDDHTDTGDAWDVLHRLRTLAQEALRSNGVVLDWKVITAHGSVYQDAMLGDFEGGDGVRFHLRQQPTCYRRGQWLMLIEVAPGPMHEAWGCFDKADQPMRYYHDVDNAKAEARLIADVLWRDRYPEVKA